jgi:hypothetical protein
MVHFTGNAEWDKTISTVGSAITNITDSLGKLLFGLDKTENRQVSYMKNIEFETDHYHAESASANLQTMTDTRANSLSFAKSMREINKTYEEAEKNPESLNSVIQWLKLAGPDAMKNMFDCFVVFRGGKTPVENTSLMFEGEDDVVCQNMMLGNVFAVRVTNVKIPQPESQTFSLPFLEREIAKTKAKVSMRYTASFSLDLDQNLFYLDKFQRLAGRYTRITKDWSSEKGAPYSSVTANYTTPPKGNKFIMNMLSRVWHSQMRYDDVDKRRIDIIVQMKNLSPQVSAEYQYKDIDMPVYVFEDVRFLGSADDIEFSRESSDKMEVTEKFIFRRLYKRVIPTSKITYTVGVTKGNGKTILRK